MGFVALASAVIGALGVRFARSTSDFLVASRTVGPAANAGAISGEYLSAASFLGIAGLILRDGVDALWYPVGFTAGYLALLLFVAAPLRRSGAYTVPDFAEARMRSPALRKVCTVFVVVIGWLYLLPQLQGAGLTVTTVTGLPSWMGAVAAAVVVVATVVLGGMRSITFVQAFQYWLKLTALALPAVMALIFFLSDDRTFDREAPPQFPEQTTVDVRTNVVLEVLIPVTLTATGDVDGVQVTTEPLHWESGTHTVRSGAELVFPSGSAVPVVAGAPASDASWLTPYSGGRENGLLATYSLIIALFLGTMGLPHVLVRFYTNPDGRAARRTVVIVLAMLGGFYVVVTLLGALSRLYTPQLLVSGDTDAAVLLLPSAVLGSGWAGALLGGLVAAGAWAAFLSTSSGLVVSIAGVLSTDLLRSSRVRDFRLATRGRRDGAARPLPGRHPAGLLGGRRPGVRGGRVHVLPAARAGHLVARADSAGCDRRGAGRRGRLRRGGGGEPRRARRLRLAGCAALPARDRHGAGRVPGDDPGQPVHGEAAPGRHRPGAAAAARAGAPGAEPRPARRAAAASRPMSCWVPVR